MHLCGDGKVLKVRDPAPPFAPLYPPQFFFRFRVGRKIGRVDRLAVQRLGEVEQQLRQIALKLETVRARAVIPFLEAAKFNLQAQILKIQIVGALLLCFGALFLPLAIQQQRAHHRLQRSAVLR